MVAITAQGSVGAHGNGFPDTHHINAGIAAPNISKPSMYRTGFLIICYVKSEFRGYSFFECVPGLLKNRL